MQFYVKAIYTDGTMVFQGCMNYVPRIGEEIEINGYVFVVENIRYVFEEGTNQGTKVRMLLSKSKTNF